MDDGILLKLLIVFAPLSLLSLGGGQAIVAELHSQSVEVQGWLTNQQFADFFAISRAAPGPGTLIAALIGWHAAGFAGALVATMAMYIPSSLLVYSVGSWWQRRRGSIWVAVLERGLGPPAIGLMLAGALSVLEASNPTPLSLSVTAISAVVIYFYRIGPYLVMSVVVAIYLPIALMQVY
jgi:chromate transporter